MIDCVVTRIESCVNILSNIFVKVFFLYFICEGICISKWQFSPLVVLWKDVIVMKVVHQGFAQVQYAHTQIYWLIIKNNFVLFMWTAIRFSSKIVTRS